jgi:hypothetical protein
MILFDSVEGLFDDQAGDFDDGGVVNAVVTITGLESTLLLGRSLLLVFSHLPNRSRDKRPRPQFQPLRQPELNLERQRLPGNRQLLLLELHLRLARVMRLQLFRVSQQHLKSVQQQSWLKLLARAASATPSFCNSILSPSAFLSLRSPSLGRWRLLRTSPWSRPQAVSLGGPNCMQ